MSKSRSELIFEHALKFATPFRTTLGQSWAIIPDGSGRYHGWPIASRNFARWMAHSFHHEHSIFPGGYALNNAVRMFDAHARHSEFPVSDIFTRIGWRGDRRIPQSVLLHLANTNHELVEITAHGNRIVAAESWHFLDGPSTLPLPRPIASDVTLHDHLRALFNIDGIALERAIVWLFAALRPSGPYPILVLSGPPASGKSMLARMLRHLIDPSATPLLEPPTTEPRLFTMALHNHVLAFDDVDGLPRAIARAIARLAGGTGLAICGRNMFDEPQPLPLARPIITTTTAGLPACFSTNQIRVQLNAIDSENVQTETAHAQKHRAAAPAILGTLCAAVTAALSNATANKTAPVSRFADVHQWTMAAAPILGLTPQQINRALSANPLVDAVDGLLQTQSEWTGTASDLLKNLRTIGFSAATDARHLSVQLNATPLALFGIALEKSSTHDKHLIHLRRQSTEISLRTAAL
jgi:hypothetical protein